MSESLELRACYAKSEKGKYVCVVDPNNSSHSKSEVLSRCPCKGDFNQCAKAVSEKMITYMIVKIRPDEAKCSSDPDDAWPASRSGDVGLDILSDRFVIKD